jgi:hypothetical protein
MATWGGEKPDWTAPATKLVAVTPHDDNDLAGGICRALWVGGAGNVAVIAADDTDPVTIVAVSAGRELPISVKRVRATNTTATSIVALY